MDKGSDGSIFDSRVEHYNLKIFKLVLDSTMAVLAAVSLKSFIFNTSFYLPDLANLIFVAVARYSLVKKPSLRKPLIWLVFISIVINSVDGMLPPGNELPSSYVLFPSLVIYAVLVGDLMLTLAATLVVLGMFVFAYYYNGPLPRRDLFMLINLAIFTVAAGFGSLLTWYFHRLMQKELFSQLTVNQRLTSALFHDIANPLMVIMNVADKAKAAGKATEADIERIGRMAERIAGIRDAVRGLDRETGLILNPTPVTFGELAVNMRDIFGAGFEDKGLRLSVVGDEELSMMADRDVLENSILANIFSNAIKNSPTGGEIVFSSRKTAEGISIEIENQGTGFPPDIISWFSSTQNQPLQNSPRGHGYGLWIASSYAIRMGGRMEIRNLAGGASVTLLMPAA